MRWWPWPRRPPEAPRNVQVSVRGRRIPVELVYRGRTLGMHHWVAVTPIAVAAEDMPYVQLHADEVPGRTAITIEGSITGVLPDPG